MDNYAKYAWKLRAKDFDEDALRKHLDILEKGPVSFILELYKYKNGQASQEPQVVQD